jgi:outer membrane protein assembly factor BamE (lipoprotein component of BamABCDE complex)
MSLVKILSLIATGICCLCLFVLGSFMLDEGYNPVVPGIDTNFAEGYDEAKFNSIKEGMDTTEVIQLIGRPKFVQSGQAWHYTSDGKCTWADFAWLKRRVMIGRDGKVKGTHASVSYE